MKKVSIGTIIGYVLVIFIMVGLVGAVASLSKGFKEWDIKEWFNSEVSTDVYSSENDETSSSSGHNSGNNNGGGSSDSSGNNESEHTDPETNMVYQKLIDKDTEVKSAIYCSRTISDQIYGTIYEEGWHYYKPNFNPGVTQELEEWDFFESTDDYYVVKHDSTNGNTYPWAKVEWDISFKTSWDNLILSHYVNNGAIEEYISVYDPKIVFSITKDVSLDGISLKGCYLSIPFNLNENTIIEFNNLPAGSKIEFGNTSYSITDFKQFLSQNGYSTSIQNFIFRYADKCDIRIPHETRYYFTDLVLAKAG